MNSILDAPSTILRDKATAIIETTRCVQLVCAVGVSATARGAAISLQAGSQHQALLMAFSTASPTA